MSIHFEPVRDYFHLDSVRIDTINFLLYYKISFVLFFSASILSTSSQYLGDPILCSEVVGISENTINSFCWVHQTFSIPSQWKGEIGKHWPYPGVSSGFDPNDSKGHSYYQWVGIVLMLQAFSFYIPRFIWKNCEGGRLKSLVQDNLKKTPLALKNREAEMDLLADYWKKFRGKHVQYASIYLGCEFLNLMNVFGQFYLTNLFLDGQFLTYGADVVIHYVHGLPTETGPMSKVFPKVTKCTYHKYGPSGTIERLDSICLLSINILNEKIFLLTWFWLIFLALFSAIYLCFVLSLTVCSGARQHLIASIVAPPIGPNDVSRALTSPRLTCFQLISDWFIFFMLCHILVSREGQLSDLDRQIPFSSHEESQLSHLDQNNRPKVTSV